MDIIDPATVSRHLSLELLVPALREGFLAHHAGEVYSAPITNMDFPEANGEMHIKPGYLCNSDLVCVKLVTCFYDNPSMGRSTRDGAIVVASRRTGEWLSLIHDAGRITDLRTCGASAVAVDALAGDGPIELGLIGAGTQAALHVAAIACVRQIARIRVWGRNEDKALRFARETAAKNDLRCEVADIADICRLSDVIVSATPARAPVVPGCGFKEGAVLVAMGADAVGKRELVPEALGLVAHVICDDVAQCRIYGETQWLSDSRSGVASLGEVLFNGGVVNRRPDDVVLFDSTGLGFQDAVGVDLLLRSLANRS